MITARREDGLRDAARQVDGAEWFVANAGRPEDAQAAVAECIDRLGALDILVNNAGDQPLCGGRDRHRPPPGGEDPGGQPPRSAHVVAAGVAGVDAGARRGDRQHRIDGGVRRRAGDRLLRPLQDGPRAAHAAAGHGARPVHPASSPSRRVSCRTEMSRMLWDGHEAGWNAKLPMQRIGEPDDIGRARAVPRRRGGQLDHRTLLDGGRRRAGDRRCMTGSPDGDAPPSSVARRGHG